MSSPTGLGPFDPRDTDGAKIERGIAVPCRMCERIGRRLRLTRQYCACCHHGFCPELGGTAVSGRGSCLECGRHGVD